MSFDGRKFIQRHLHGKSVKKDRITYKMTDLMRLCKLSIAAFQKEASSLARINPPCVIVGDIHGQFNDLLRMFSSYSKNGKAGCFVEKFVFLGDYVDRGRRSLECISLLLALKNQFPEAYTLLRGNHEARTINEIYGFYTELKERFSPSDAQVLFDLYNEVFNYMPLAAVVGAKMLCMHGGISPHLKSFEDIQKIPRPLPDPVTCPLANDLLWSDPLRNLEGFSHNTVRGISVYFGEDEVVKLCKALNISCIVRGHQLMSTGFGHFAGKKLFTIFTAPRYEKNNDNSGATFFIDKDGEMGVRILRPDGHDNEQDAEPTSDSASCFFGKEKEGEEKAKKWQDAVKAVGTEAKN